MSLWHAAYQCLLVSMIRAALLIVYECALDVDYVDNNEFGI